VVFSQKLIFVLKQLNMIEKLGTVFSMYYRLTHKHRWWALLTIVSFALANTTSTVVLPIFVSKIFEAVSNNTDAFKPFWLFAGLLILYNIFYRLGDIFIIIFQTRGIQDIRQRSMEVVISQPLRFFANLFSGALLNQMNKFARSFEDIFDMMAFYIMFTVLQIFGVTIVLFIKAPIMGILFFIWSIGFVAICIIMAKRRFPIDMRENALNSRLIGVTADILTNVSTVIQFGQRKEELENYHSENSAHMDALRKSAYMSAIQKALMGTMTAILHIGAVGTALFLKEKGKMSAADVTLVYLYMGIIAATMWELGRIFVKFTKSVTDALEMVEVYDQIPEVILQDTVQTNPIKKGSIVIENVMFGYNAGKTVFDNLNLVIESGSHVGIVGASGAGKTTLISMLMRNNELHAGSIAIDGLDITGIEHDLLRKRIALVPQDVSLMHRTVAENIAYGKPEATREEVINAAKHARIHEEIMSFPNQYDTTVGERGIKLSGGQRQRIAIARALLIDAPIIVLDEATSSLDAITETYIKEILKNELVGKTVIIIAHRLSTVRHCRIVVLEQGVVKEDGMHHELMEKDGLYANLIKHQFSK